MNSIKRGLQQKLYVSIPKQAKALTGVELNVRKPENIVLYLSEREGAIAYRSPIALKLASQLRESPQVIARQLMASFLQNLEENSEEALFEGRATAQGWLKFSLSDRGLTGWLQHLLEGVNDFSPLPTSSFSPHLHLFPLQYVHARCCSLLRSGDRDGMITLDGSDRTPPPWKWLAPQPIPWLNTALMSPSAYISRGLLGPYEMGLIALFLEVVDAIEGTSTGDRLKLARRLSEGIFEFDRSCRIWGEIVMKTPELSQVRLGLIAIAQRLSGELLRQFGAIAPDEL